MSRVSFELLSEDAELLLAVMEQVNCQGKEGAIQLLRIIHALENPIVPRIGTQEDPDSVD